MNKLCIGAFARFLSVNDYVRYFPIGILPSGNFPRIFSQWKLPKFAASQKPTSQVYPNRSACSSGRAQPSSPSQQQRLPQCSLGRLERPNLTFGKVPLGNLHIWEVATWNIVTWEVVLGSHSENTLHLNDKGF